MSASSTKPRKARTAHDCESWDLEHWPAGIYPHNTGRARYLLRAHRDELILAGVVTRVGRDLVVIGSRYRRWLEKRSHRVVMPDDLRGAARASYEARRCGEEPTDLDMDVA